MIRNLKVINAYPEFRTTAGINQVKNAVIAGNPPAGLTPEQTARFNQKFLGGEWVVVGVLGFLRARTRSSEIKIQTFSRYRFVGRLPGRKRDLFK